MAIYCGAGLASAPRTSRKALAWAMVIFLSYITLCPLPMIIVSAVLISAGGTLPPTHVAALEKFPPTAVVYVVACSVFANNIQPDNTVKLLRKKIFISRDLGNCKYKLFYMIACPEGFVGIVFIPGCSNTDAACYTASNL